MSLHFPAQNGTQRQMKNSWNYAMKKKLEWFGSRFVTVFGKSCWASCFFFRFIDYVLKVTILLMLIYGWFWWNGDVMHTEVGGINRTWHEATQFVPPKYAMKVLTESNIHVLRLKFIVHCLFKVWPLICPSKLRHSDW